MKEFIIKYWLEVMFSSVLTVIVVGLKYVIGKVKQEHQEQENIKNGVLALLHDRLYQYAEYLLSKEKVSIDEVENLNHIYRSYACLGGNGTGETLYKAVKKKFEYQGSYHWIIPEELKQIYNKKHRGGDLK